MRDNVLSELTMADRLDGAIVIYPGFRQTTGPRTGVFTLHDRISHSFPDRNHHLLLLRPWNTNHRADAERIEYADPVTTVVVGYSYGCGWAVPQLAKHLRRKGRYIDALFLIDPVPRYRLLPAKALSLSRFGKYTVPANVRTVWCWRSANKARWTSPVGRPIRKLGSQTTIVSQQVLGSLANLERYEMRYRDAWQVNDVVSHVNIDDLKEIHDVIVGAIPKVFARLSHDNL